MKNTRLHISTITHESRVEAASSTSASARLLVEDRVAGAYQCASSS